MNTERDELATIIETAYDLNPGMASFELLAHTLLAAGYSRPKQVSTVAELGAAIVRAFEHGENLVLLSTWRPWIIWEDDYGDVNVSSLPVEDDPERLTLADIALPAMVLFSPVVGK